VDDWDNYFYDLAARNSIDVGEFVGRCLAALTASHGVQPTSIHLAGHRHSAVLYSTKIFTYNLIADFFSIC
jgi:hypothetical protein